MINNSQSSKDTARLQNFLTCISIKGQERAVYTNRRVSWVQKGGEMSNFLLNNAEEHFLTFEKKCIALNVLNFFGCVIRMFIMSYILRVFKNDRKTIEV